MLPSFLLNSVIVLYAKKWKCTGFFCAKTFAFMLSLLLFCLVAGWPLTHSSLCVMVEFSFQQFRRSAATFEREGIRPGIISSRLPFNYIWGTVMKRQLTRLKLSVMLCRLYIQMCCSKKKKGWDVKDMQHHTACLCRVCDLIDTLLKDNQTRR